MTRRYGTLYTIGTISVILAWVLLVLGVIAAIGAWIGLRGLLGSLDVNAGIVPISAALPPLLVGIIGFIQFYVLGKVLHLLVELDDTTRQLSTQAQASAGSSGDGGGSEISGELKRQAKLIADTLDSTRQLQDQVAALSQSLEPPAVGDTLAPLADEEDAEA
jgi:hypothetical protein